jgi:hypothetical protein
MSDIRLGLHHGHGGLKPGAIRVNDANFVIMLPLAEALDGACTSACSARSAPSIAP